MTDSKTVPEPEVMPNANTDADQTTVGGAGAAPSGAPGAQSDEALNAEIAALKDKVLRTLADMENLRRRTEREVADARAYGVTSFAREMLTVADNLRRGIESVPGEARAAAEGPLKALVEGIELTERDFLASLGRFGVRKLEPLGQKFDPNMHQAMFEIADESVPAGTVNQVAQAGYAIGDRVLRPALVGVAKGGPKAAATAEAASMQAGGGK